MTLSRLPDTAAAVDGEQRQLRDTICETLFDTGHDAVFVYRLEADGLPGRFLDVNRRACEWLEYSRAALLALGPLDVLTPDALATHPGRRLLDRRPLRFETTLRSRNGNTLQAESTAHLLEFQGQPAVLSVVRDVSARHAQQNALRQAEEKYRQIFENALDGIYQTSPDGRLLSANPALARVLGYDSVADLLAAVANVSKLYVAPEMRATVTRRLEEHGSYAGLEYQLRRPDGSILWVSDNARMVRNEAGEAEYYEGILQDITPRKVAEEALAQSEAKYRMLVDTSQDGIFIARDRRFVYVNTALATALGHRPDELIGADMMSLVAVEDREAALKKYAELERRGGAMQYQLRMRHADGTSLIEVAAHAGLMPYQDGYAVAGSVRDITGELEAERRLRHHAYHDQLTGLANRSLFTERLQRAIDRGREADAPGFAVFFLDLDRFKLVNDGLGHSYGDTLLRGIAERLQQSTNPGDLVARYGGDEFVILGIGLNRTAAADLAEKILESLADPFDLETQEVFTNASIGIVLSHPDYVSPDEILRDADTAMYHAKHQGRARYAVFTRTMRDNAQRRLSLESALQRAVERDELLLHFEPIRDAASGRLHAFEALLRWEHPELGLLVPGDFLQLAEESGLVTRIGAWVLETACREARDWLTEMPGLQVNVNIADRQFAHPRLVEHVRQALQSSGLPAANLQLEITESVFMENREAASRQFRALRELGVGIQMDDFGTGYSSLAGLREHRPDALKIDRHFVQHVHEDTDAAAVVRTIIRLAADLDLRVIAEGVENRAQEEMLGKLGCSLMQGYLYTHGLTAAGARDWIRNHGLSR